LQVEEGPPLSRMRLRAEVHPSLSGTKAELSKHADRIQIARSDWRVSMELLSASGAQWRATYKGTYSNLVRRSAHCSNVTTSFLVAAKGRRHLRAQSAEPSKDLQKCYGIYVDESRMMCSRTTAFRRALKVVAHDHMPKNLLENWCRRRDAPSKCLMFFQQHCKNYSLHRASQNGSFLRAVEIFPSSMRNLGSPISAKLLGNARKIPYCISGLHSGCG